MLEQHFPFTILEMQRLVLILAMFQQDTTLEVLCNSGWSFNFTNSQSFFSMKLITCNECKAFTTMATTVNGTSTCNV